MRNGDVDPAEKEGGSHRPQDPAADQLPRARCTSRRSRDAQRPPADGPRTPPPELLIIADRTTPYRLLVEVMFSAKQKEAGYKHFRLIVQKSVPDHARRSDLTIAGLDPAAL